MTSFHAEKCYRPLNARGFYAAVYESSWSILLRYYAE